jgi:hypothetical protein
VTQHPDQKCEDDHMAKSTYHTAPSRKALDGEKAKIATLRQLRLANDAARREAGTWGEMTVGEIAHEPSGEVFVLSWKGRKEPDLARLHRSRLPELSPAEHERLLAWLVHHRVPVFQRSLVGWDLSRAEAKRVKLARIAEHKAKGSHVINDAPVMA